jgi:hypothetical protein
MLDSEVKDTDHLFYGYQSLPAALLAWLVSG